MLKLHHMNLLNEIQETTLMMNLYQQQQLQQQQQQLQAQASAEMGNDPSLAMMMHGSASGGLDMFAGQLSQRGSLGLGSPMGGAGFGNAAQLQLMQQQQQVQQQVQQAQQQALLHPPVATGESAANAQSSNDLEGRIAQLKQDIAKNDGDRSSEKKRSAESTEEGSSKRAKKADGDQPDKTKARKAKSTAAAADEE